MELHDRLKAAREDADLTQAQVAEQTGFDRQEGSGMEPIEIHVRLSPDDEVLALRARVAELEAQAEAARAERDRLEYKYRCESLINTELIDLCKREGVPFREALTRRPW